MSDRNAVFEDAPTLSELGQRARDDLRTDAAGWAERVHELAVWLSMCVMFYVLGSVTGWQAAVHSDRLLMPGSTPPIPTEAWLALGVLVTTSVVTAPLEAWLEDDETE